MKPVNAPLAARCLTPLIGLYCLGILITTALIVLEINQPIPQGPLAPSERERSDGILYFGFLVLAVVPPLLSIVPMCILMKALRRDPADYGFVILTILLPPTYILSVLFINALARDTLANHGYHIGLLSIRRAHDDEFVISPESVEEFLADDELGLPSMGYHDDYLDTMARQLRDCHIAAGFFAVSLGLGTLLALTIAFASPPEPVKPIIVGVFVACVVLFGVGQVSTTITGYRLLITLGSTRTALMRSLIIAALPYFSLGFLGEATAEARIVLARHGYTFGLITVCKAAPQPHQPWTTPEIPSVRAAPLTPLDIKRQRIAVWSRRTKLSLIVSAASLLAAVPFGVALAVISHDPSPLRSTIDTLSAIPLLVLAVSLFALLMSAVRLEQVKAAPPHDIS